MFPILLFLWKNPMKTKFFCFLLLFPFAVSAQNFMTFGDVYDFSVGDKFQYHGTLFYWPDFPNAERITITGKYYSPGNDTVFYIEYHDNYDSWFDGDSLHYEFNSFTDTVFYTRLDTTTLAAAREILLDTGVNNFDTLNYFSEYYCDSLVNGYSYSVGWFEPEFHSILYGRGLGRVDYLFRYPSEFYGYRIHLFYYEKNGVGCGTPDLLTAVNKKDKPSGVKIYPNPARQYFVVESGGSPIEKMEIYNSTGKLIVSQNTHKNKFVYRCNSLGNGIYFVRLSAGSNVFLKKLIIK